MTAPTRRARRATRIDRAAHNLVLFGCWMGLVLIGACVAGAVLASYNARYGWWTP